MTRLEPIERHGIRARGGKEMIEHLKGKKTTLMVILKVSVQAHPATNSGQGYM
jgi:hypothetical protein